MRLTVLNSSRPRSIAFVMASFLFVCCLLLVSQSQAAIDWPEDRPLTFYVPQISSTGTGDGNNNLDAAVMDVIIYLKARTELPFEVVRGSWTEIYPSFESNPNSIIALISETPERALSYSFYPITTMPHVYRYLAGASPINQLSDLGERSIGLYGFDSVAFDILLANLPAQQVHVFDRQQDIEMALALGTVEAILTNSNHVGLDALNWSNVKTHTRIALDMPAFSKTENLAVHSQAPGMAELLEAIGAEIEGSPALLNLQRVVSQRQMSKEMGQMLRNENSVVVCLADALPPYHSFVNGIAQGMVVDVLHTLFDSLGILVTFLPVASPSAQSSAVARRQCDVSWSPFGLADNHTLYGSLPVLDSSFVVLQRSEKEGVADSAKSLKLSINRIIEPIVRSDTSLSRFEIILSDPFNQVADVVKGRADLLLMDLYNWEANKAHLSKLGLSVSAFQPLNFQMQWITHSEALRDLIEIAMSSLGRDYVANLISEYAAREVRLVEVKVMPWLQIGVFTGFALCIFAALAVYTWLSKQAKLAQERALRHTQNFLANMSHELRNPMNSILGMAELMANSDTLPPLEKEQAQIIHRSGKHMLHLLNDVLDSSKIEAGEITIEHVSFNVLQVLQDIDAQFSDAAIKKGVGLQCPRRCQVVNPQRIGDPTRLMQIITNLVSNAIKFTREGFVAVDISEGEGGSLLILVEDSGIGIPADKRKQIFQRFKQVDDSTTRRFGGTGLGLSISLELVELMGGTLLVSSDNGLGTRFSLEVNLPLDSEHQQAAVSLAVIEEASKEKEPISEESVDDFVATMPRPHPADGQLAILLVDDVKTNMYVLHLMLSKCLPNAEIDEVESVDEALVCLQQKNYPLVFTDIQMPGKTGIDLLETVRENKFEKINPSIAIVACTGEDNVDELALLFDGAIPKPTSVEHLRGVLSQLNLSSPEHNLKHVEQSAPLPSVTQGERVKQFFMDLARHNNEEDWQEAVLVPCYTMLELLVEEMRMHLARGELLAIQALAFHFNTLGSLLGDEPLKTISRRLTSARPLTIDIALENFIEYGKRLKEFKKQRSAS